MSFECQKATIRPVMTDRQAKILAAMVEEYAEVATPIGSITLAKLFKVSSATLRAEMALLEQLGYIEQPHVSAGRIPTDKGYRWYVNTIQANQSDWTTLENDNSRALGVRVRDAGEPAQAIKSAVDSLVQLTANAGLGTIGSQLYLNGLTNLFAQPEFASGETAREVAYLLDNIEPWLRETAPRRPVSVFIGHENPIGKTSGCSLIISRFSSPYSDNSYIGIIGSTRQNYKQAMALVGRAGQMLEKEFHGQTD